MNWKLLVVGTIPGVIAGLALEKAAEESFRNPLLIAATLSAFGLLLFYFDRVGRKSRDMAATTMRDALVVGCAQALAIVPGVSRSGITITAGLMLGLTRSTAVRFSFLLSAPIIGGAGVLKAKHILHALMAGGAQMNAVLIGFGSSLVASLLAIGLLSYIVKSRTFNVFVAYRLVLALVIVVVVIFR
jgi:undecaprenyl-diphosphatase